MFARCNAHPFGVTVALQRISGQVHPDQPVTQRERLLIERDQPVLTQIHRLYLGLRGKSSVVDLLKVIEADVQHLEGFWQLFREQNADLIVL